MFSCSHEFHVIVSNDSFKLIIPIAALYDACCHLEEAEVENSLYHMITLFLPTFFVIACSCSLVIKAVTHLLVVIWMVINISTSIASSKSFLFVLHFTLTLISPITIHSFLNNIKTGHHMTGVIDNKNPTTMHPTVRHKLNLKLKEQTVVGVFCLKVLTCLHANK